MPDHRHEFDPDTGERVKSPDGEAVALTDKPKKKTPVCVHCQTPMKRGTKTQKSMGLQLLGVLVFIIAIPVLFLFPVGTVIGVIMMLVALNLGYSKAKGWKCGACGYFFQT